MAFKRAVGESPGRAQPSPKVSSRPLRSYLSAAPERCGRLGTLVRVCSPRDDVRGVLI